MEKFPSSSKYENKAPETPEEWNEFTVGEYLNKLGLSLAELKDKELLDIGAGSGTFVRAAVEAGANVIAFDLPAENEEQKNSKAAGITFIEGNAMKLPFKDNNFDLVIQNAALPHFVIPEAESFHEARVAAVAEAIRVLKPGGEIRFASVPRNERPDNYQRAYSLNSLLQTLREDPKLEISEEPLKVDVEHYDEEGNIEALSDYYRIIIKKKTD